MDGVGMGMGVRIRERVGSASGSMARLAWHTEAASACIWACTQDAQDE